MCIFMCACGHSGVISDEDARARRTRRKLTDTARSTSFSAAGIPVRQLRRCAQTLAPSFSNVRSSKHLTPCFYTAARPTHIALCRGRNRTAAGPSFLHPLSVPFSPRSLFSALAYITYITLMVKWGPTALRPSAIRPRLTVHT